MSEELCGLSLRLRQLAEREASGGGAQFEAGLRQSLRREARRRRAQRRARVAASCLVGALVALIVAMALPCVARNLPFPVGGELRRLDARSADLKARLDAQTADLRRQLAVWVALSGRERGRLAAAQRATLRGHGHPAAGVGKPSRQAATLGVARGAGRPAVTASPTASSPSPSPSGTATPAATSPPTP